MIDDENDDEIAMDEIIKALKHMIAGRTLGYDKVSPEMLKAGGGRMEILLQTSSHKMIDGFQLSVRVRYAKISPRENLLPLPNPLGNGLTSEDAHLTPYLTHERRGYEINKYNNASKWWHIRERPNFKYSKLTSLHEKIDDGCRGRTIEPIPMHRKRAHGLGPIPLSESTVGLGLVVTAAHRQSQEQRSHQRVTGDEEGMGHLMEGRGLGCLAGGSCRVYLCASFLYRYCHCIGNDCPQHPPIRTGAVWSVRGSNNLIPRKKIMGGHASARGD
ncbi:hypothetical protein EVAR_66397_1 [Eumeta japonica]|uniref:Uncharacterized protein n=1 Tax=Eumeta variegata TaxID=151549 RepID=A0A4C1ZYX9_EUMVA|nr:hypothetical protein EVAR_66397_1 [Eumeta japonica]